MGRERNCAFIRLNTIIIFGNANSDEVITCTGCMDFNTQPRSIYKNSIDWIPYYGQIVFNFPKEISSKN